MKSRYFGIFLIVIGFPMPFILRGIFPTLLYASVPSAVCFWAGFLILLRPVDYDIKLNPYIRWARYAIIANIIMTILLFGYAYLILYLKIQKGVGFDVMRLLSFITAPVESIFDKIVPPPMAQLPEGSVQVTNTFIRSLLTQFFNLAFYAFLGIIAKFINDKKITKVSSGSQGPCAR